MAEVISYSNKELDIIIKSDNFQNKLLKYKQMNNDKISYLKDTINSVKENKTYLRFSSSRKNENLSQSDIFLKNINSILNKLTECTKINLMKELSEILKNNEKYIELFYEDILFKCIDTPMNCKLYVLCIQELSFLNINLHESQYKMKLDKLYDKVININKDTNMTEYKELCFKNKIIDNTINYSKLITYLDIYDIYSHNLIEMINKMVNSINISNKSDENYKYISNLYEIFTILQNKYNILEDCKEKLIEYSKILNSKNKFKLLDIIDLC